MTTVTLLATVALVLVAPLLWSAVRVPAGARLAARNIGRRRHEALLVTGGAMLGTAIITASLVTGDVIDSSVRSGVDNVLGPIDVRVRTDDAAALAAWDTALATRRAEQVPSTVDVDGQLAWVETTASLVAGGLGDAGVNVASVDLDDARAFGDDLDATGLAAVHALDDDEVVLVESVAGDLAVGVGDTVTVHAFGQERDLTVSHVVARTGLAGYAQVLTAAGVVTELAGDPAAPGIVAELLVSTAGGVRDAVAPSDALLDELRTISGADATGGAAGRVTVEAVKQDLLGEADAAGTEFTTLFASIGSFAVIAGVLLLVNLFVMLAEERRRDLGTLRALGMRRGLLARTFATEGALYAGASAVVGALLGAGLGIGIAWAAGRIFDITGDGLSFAPTVEPLSLVTAGLTGFVISLVTVWVLSVRIARANVIRSLRELPAPPATHRVRTLVLGTLGVVGGVALTMRGVGGDVAEAIIAGVPLALLSAVTLARRVVPGEAAIAVAGAGSIGWALVATQVWSDAFAASEMTVFVVQGVVLVAGAVAVAVATDRLWGVVSDTVTARTGGIAGRLGTAYPLARRGRTGLLLGMFAIVVFTMTFIAALDSSFTAETDRFAADAGGGWDVRVTAPVSALDAGDSLRDHPSVTGVAALQPGAVEVRMPDGASWTDRATAIDASLLATTPPALVERADGMVDDAAVFAALLADPSLVVVNDLLYEGASVGDRVTLATVGGAATRTFEVVGVLASPVPYHGAVGSAAAFDGLAVPGRSQQFLLDVVGDPAAVAAALDADLVAAGVDATAFTTLATEETAVQSSFFRLLQVFLGLGLVVGVAGLGVMLVRAVRERTRQVGTLRALGVRRATVAASFLVEAGFVAVQGVLIGGVLGLVSAWQVLTRTDTFGQLDLGFVVPTVPLLLIVAVPLLAAVAATVAPARRAAAIRPAVALRVVD